LSVLDLNNLFENGVFTLEKQVLTPNKNGIIADVVLKLPAYKNGMYYRPFSEVKASENRMKVLWFQHVFELSNYKQTK
jgi:hypothetical protein